MFILDNEGIEFNTCKNLIKACFCIKKSNHEKLKKLAKKYKKSNSYILDLILDKVKL